MIGDTHLRADIGEKRKGTIIIVKAMLMVRMPGGKNWEGKGSREYAELPRIGDGLELTLEEGQAHIFRVVGFHHPEKPTMTAGDLYAVHVGPTTKVVVELRQKS